MRIDSSVFDKVTEKFNEDSLAKNLTAFGQLFEQNDQSLLGACEDKMGSFDYNNLRTMSFCQKRNPEYAEKLKKSKNFKQIADLAAKGAIIADNLLKN